MRQALAVVFVAACGRTAAPVPSWDDAAVPEAPASASAAPSASASAAPSASASAEAGTCSYDLRDLPEPVAPPAECLFHREVRCVPASPALSAWQKWFPYCPKEGKPWADSTIPTKAQFSAKETCAAKADQCCYVQFVAGACR